MSRLIFYRITHYCRYNHQDMKLKITRWAAPLIAALVAVSAPAADKPNILFIVSDDTGYGDLEPYGGGIGRGMPTPNIQKMAKEGMMFWDFYAQPSCTPGRAAMQTGRIPNRSGMTTVAFQGAGRRITQGGVDSRFSPKDWWL
jgi:hypothetical protein